ncbi:hypothetical protein Droror1_Dr00004928 [Drosera rotundifolia]
MGRSTPLPHTTLHRTLSFSANPRRRTPQLITTSLPSISSRVEAASKIRQRRSRERVVVEEVGPDGLRKLVWAADFGP